MKMKRLLEVTAFEKRNKGNTILKLFRLHRLNLLIPDMNYFGYRFASDRLHFSNLLKSKTVMSPNDYRSINAR